MNAGSPRPRKIQQSAYWVCWRLTTREKTSFFFVFPTPSFFACHFRLPLRPLWISRALDLITPHPLSLFLSLSFSGSGCAYRDPASMPRIRQKARRDKEEGTATVRQRKPAPRRESRPGSRAPAPPPIKSEPEENARNVALFLYPPGVPPGRLPCVPSYLLHAKNSNAQDGLRTPVASPLPQTDGDLDGGGERDRLIRHVESACSVDDAAIFACAPGGDRKKMMNVLGRMALVATHYSPDFATKMHGYIIMGLATAAGSITFTTVNDLCKYANAESARGLLDWTCSPADCVSCPRVPLFETCPETGQRCPVPLDQLYARLAEAKFDERFVRPEDLIFVDSAPSPPALGDAQGRTAVDGQELLVPTSYSALMEDAMGGTMSDSIGDAHLLPHPTLPGGCTITLPDVLQRLSGTGCTLSARTVSLQSVSLDATIHSASSVSGSKSTRARVKTEQPHRAPSDGVDRTTVSLFSMHAGYVKGGQATAMHKAIKEKNSTEDASAHSLWRGQQAHVAHLPPSLAQRHETGDGGTREAPPPSTAHRGDDGNTAGSGSRRSRRNRPTTSTKKTVELTASGTSTMTTTTIVHRRPSAGAAKTTRGRTQGKHRRDEPIERVVHVPVSDTDGTPLHTASFSVGYASPYDMFRQWFNTPEVDIKAYGFSSTNPEDVWERDMQGGTADLTKPTSREHWQRKYDDHMRKECGRTYQYVKSHVTGKIIRVDMPDPETADTPTLEKLAEAFTSDSRGTVQDIHTVPYAQWTHQLLERWLRRKGRFDSLENDPVLERIMGRRSRGSQTCYLCRWKRPAVDAEPRRMVRARRAPQPPPPIPCGSLVPESASEVGPLSESAPARQMADKHINDGATQGQGPSTGTAAVSRASGGSCDTWHSDVLLVQSKYMCPIVDRYNEDLFKRARTAANTFISRVRASGQYDQETIDMLKNELRISLFDMGILTRARDGDPPQSMCILDLSVPLTLDDLRSCAPAPRPALPPLPSVFADPDRVFAYLRTGSAEPPTNDDESPAKTPGIIVPHRGGKLHACESDQDFLQRRHERYAHILRVMAVRDLMRHEWFLGECRSALADIESDAMQLQSAPSVGGPRCQPPAVGPKQETDMSDADKPPMVVINVADSENETNEFGTQDRETLARVMQRLTIDTPTVILEMTDGDGAASS